MAVPQTYQNTMTLHLSEPPRSISGLNRLFSAAVVNQQFCRLLLDDPMSALRQGYRGDAFRLTLEEQALLLSVQARSLPDLASQIHKALGK
ncbi:MAG: hypothetical protein ACOYYU_18940 [Chloroflexota bacterium]